MGVFIYLRAFGWGIFKRFWVIIPSLFTDPFDFNERWLHLNYSPPQYLFWILLSLGIVLAIVLTYYQDIKGKHVYSNWLVKNMHKLLSSLRDKEMQIVNANIPYLVQEHDRKMWKDAYYSTIATIKGGQDKDIPFSYEQITDMKFRNIFPRNQILENIKQGNKDIRNNIKRLRWLQSEILDGVLDRLISYERSHKDFTDAFRVYRAIMVNCYDYDPKDILVIDKQIMSLERSLRQDETNITQRLSEIRDGKIIKIKKAREQDG